MQALGVEAQVLVSGGDVQCGMNMFHGCTLAGRS
jgi:hypothetical protein